jgi:ATP-dependent dihydroxyacetone kinase
MGGKIMAQFINAKESLVVDSLDGLLRASGGANLARLDGYPGIKVIVRTDHKPDKKVAVICGGGSGHEPAHAGFVGYGLLTAAVCGEVFASPSVDAVFAAIMAVTGKAGCLVIFKNYTGDRLNFGLAVEKARALGKKVEVIIVREDISLPDIAQPRGIAGVMLVEKIAGYFAEKGASLATVTAMARKAADSVVSLGIALSSCTLPGIGREDRIPQGKAELGLGIHGEAGVELIAYENVKQTVHTVLDKLFSKVKQSQAYVLLINNLGSTTPLEMGVIANEALTHPKAAKIRLVVGPSLLVTSLDMHGFSLSLMPLTADFVTALKAPASPLVLPKAHSHVAPKKIKLPASTKTQSFKTSKNPALAALVQRACSTIIVQEAALNALDAKVGDGDTGSTMAAAARHISGSLNKMPLAKIDQFIAAVSDAMTRTMGGSSGVLLAILFSGASQAAASGAAWPKALQAGLQKMMDYGGAKTGDRTMIDALEPAILTLVAGGGLAAAAKAARNGANATAEMSSARAGRSSYVAAQNLKGINDPGAEAVAALFEGLA